LPLCQPTFFLQPKPFHLHLLHSADGGQEMATAQLLRRARQKKEKEKEFPEFDRPGKSKPLYRCKHCKHYKHLGLARTIYIRCLYGIFGREITKYMVIYGEYIRFWPTLQTLQANAVV
jgi:hypothetical protein